MGQGFWGGFPPAALAIPAAVENSMAAFPRRHWLALPRGRGPSQTPKFRLPRSPLSLAAGTVHREPLPAVLAANRRFKSGDARGEAPCIRKLKSPPSPPGKSALRARAGGIGGRIKAKGVGGRRQRGQAPRRVALTQVEPVPRPIQPRGCKGRSPLHKKTKNHPLPRRGRGLGG